jgi:uncharacterized membrane protein
VLDLLPAKRLAAALVIVATLMMDAFLLTIGFRYFRMWEIVALVVAGVVVGIASLIGVEGRREKLAMRILVVCGLSVVLVLAVVAIVVVDEPWF